MTSEELLRLFEQSGALLTGHFRLSSGRHSGIYYEKFTLLKQPSVCTRICEEMASRFDSAGVETVVGPTTGGIIIAYDVARYLGVEAVYAEPGERGRVFKRGFTLSKGRRVLIVDDVLTTGRSIREVIDLVDGYGADVVGICEMLDRSNGRVTFKYPLTALATVSADDWDPSECPLCKEGRELTQPGSRKL